jgi:ketoreductase RED2
MVANVQRTAIVTGSSQGIGQAIAERFASDGFGVVINSSRSVAEGEALAASLPDAIYVQADVADQVAADRLVDAALGRWGRLDVVVNNVGAKRRGDTVEDFINASDEFWELCLTRNVMGPWYLARTAAPELAKAKGAIVNIGSIAGVIASLSSIPYSVSKAALHHLTRTLASALAPDVRVNCVAPGYIGTPVTVGWDPTAAESATPLGRIGAPEEIADAVAYFAYGGFATGQVLALDGGRTLG